MSKIVQTLLRESTGMDGIGDWLILILIVTLESLIIFFINVTLVGININPYGNTDCDINHLLSFESSNQSYSMWFFPKTLNVFL